MSRLKAQLDRTAVVRDPYARWCGRGDAARRPPIPIRRLREQDEELKDALAVGHGALATELTDILLTQARTGNTVAAIFLAKARLGWIEGRAAEAPPIAPVQVNIQIPPPMSDAEFRRVIDGKAEVVADNERKLERK